MIIDIIIKPFEPLWWKMLIITLLVITIILLLSKYVKSIREQLIKLTGVTLLATAVSIHPYLIAQNQWSLHSSLPLQLCSLSGILSGAVLLYPTQFGYELLLYWGISGATHSLLTPELTQGKGDFILYEYYISHGGIILSGLLLTISAGMTVRKNSWFKIFIFTQLLLPIIGIVDFFLEANYMYLRQKPQAENPFIIGNWPWYILFLEIFLFMHFYMVYLLFYKLKKHFFENNTILKSVLSFFIINFLAINTFAQEQSLRGQVRDSESKYPLMYATVAVYKDSTIVTGATTDSAGYFRIDQLKIGKYNIKTTYVGYNPSLHSGIVINTGKETIINPELEENRNNIKEVEVNGLRKDQTVNEMSMISTRTFSVEEAKRYAGSRGDPGRMASNYAGVQGSDDSRNDIVIRGNSPLGVVWRINGTDVANPNHFAIPGTTGGGVTILNEKTLDNSDFLTGAFSAEYGNTVAGVFDLRLRNGNNEKHEFTGQFGFLGTELSAEGPISKKNHSSYLVAYRYSTLQLFESMNINIGTDAIPNYQDLTFKLNFPGKKGGNFFVYGIGGTSAIDIKISDQQKPTQEIYGEKNKDQYFKTGMGLFGIGKAFNINPTAYAQVKLTYQHGQAIAEDDLVYKNANYEIDSLIPCLGYTFKTDRTSLNAEVVKKLNPSITFKAGVNTDYLGYNLIDSSYNEATYKFTTRLDYIGTSWLIQPYAIMKYKITEKLNVNAGIHTQIHLLNNSTSLEPRIGIKYFISDQSALSFGFGMHSQMQPYYIYYYQVPNSNGEFIQPNKNLAFTHSNHYVIGYDRSLKNNSRFKIEAYYMQLYDVPVTIKSSSYSILNEGATFSRFFPDDLENKGSGFNTGVEITYEKFFSDNYFVLLTGSLFESKYKGSDRIERNTSFNGIYAANLVAGKEVKLSDHSTLSTGFKITRAGGKRYTPADTTASRLAGELVEIDSLRNTLQFKDYFRCDLKVGLKINSKKVTHEFAIDLVNIFATKNILSLTYVYDPAHPEKNPIQEEYQLGFLPIFYYKIDF